MTSLFIVAPPRRSEEELEAIRGAASGYVGSVLASRFSGRAVPLGPSGECSQEFHALVNVAAREALAAFANGISFDLSRLKVEVRFIPHWNELDVSVEWLP